MRLTIAFAVFVSILAAFVLQTDETPTAQTTVNTPRSELYASLADLYSDIERKSKSTQTVTGDPPYPVKFSFSRSEGKMLAMSGTAGFRTVQVKVWLEDGARESESVLKVQFEPESLMQRSGESDPYRALTKTLKQTSSQFIEGKRITALFGT